MIRQLSWASPLDTTEKATHRLAPDFSAFNASHLVQQPTKPWTHSQVADLAGKKFFEVNWFQFALASICCGVNLFWRQFVLAPYLAQQASKDSESQAAQILSKKKN